MVEGRTVTSPDGSVPIAVAGSAQSLRAVIVLQEAFGVNDYVLDVCRRIGEQGHLAAAPDLYHRLELSQIPYNDLPAVYAAMDTVTRECFIADLDQVVAYLEHVGYPPENTAVVGFCMGGSLALAAATTRRFAAAGTFYGGGVTTARLGFPALVELAPTLKTPWIGMFGDEDPSIPTSEVEQLRNAAARSSVPTEVIRYARVGHGFDRNRGQSAVAGAAATDAWRRLFWWFDAFFPNSTTTGGTSSDNRRSVAQSKGTS